MGETDKKPSTADGRTKNKWHHHKKKPQHSAKTNPPRQEKFQGGKDELDGNYFDCTGHGQSDRFVKTVQKIADCAGQEHKCGGVTRTEVVTQSVVDVPKPPRPAGTTTASSGADGTVTVAPPDALDISDHQSAKKIVDCQV
jgi:hypothetical protein